MTDDEIFREWLIRIGYPEDVDIEKHADLKDTTIFAMYRLDVAKSEFVESLGIKKLADRVFAIIKKVR